MSVEKIGLKKASFDARCWVQNIVFQNTMWFSADWGQFSSFMITVRCQCSRWLSSLGVSSNTISKSLSAKLTRTHTYSECLIKPWRLFPGSCFLKDNCSYSYFIYPVLLLPRFHNGRMWFRGKSFSVLSTVRDSWRLRAREVQNHIRSLHNRWQMSRFSLLTRFVHHEPNYQLNSVENEEYSASFKDTLVW